MFTTDKVVSYFDLDSIPDQFAIPAGKRSGGFDRGLRFARVTEKGGFENLGFRNRGRLQSFYPKPPVSILMQAHQKR
jgi:hypothetical protein